MTWLLVFIIMLLVVLGMSIGVIMDRKPIAGSCGSIASLGTEKECSVCDGDRQRCEGANRDESVAPGKLAYDATKRQCATFRTGRNIYPSRGQTKPYPVNAAVRTGPVTESIRRAHIM